VSQIKYYSHDNNLIVALKTSDDVPDPAPNLALVTHNHPELEAESDDGLVVYMALKDQDLDLAQRACEQLHHRHAHFLLAWCYRERYQTFGDSAEDFVNETFLRAYRQAQHFVCTDLSQGRQQILAWLFRILRNVFLDSMRSENRSPLVRIESGPDDKPSDNFAENVIAAEEGQAAKAPDNIHHNAVSAQRRNLVLQFRATLKPLEQEILDLTAQFWNSAQGRTEIDDDLRDGICNRLGIKKCSLRVYRKRLLDRLKAFIQEHEITTIAPPSYHEKHAESQ